MKKVGLIGLGYWGKILHSKLEKLSDVKFICTSKDIFEDKIKLLKSKFEIIHIHGNNNTGTQRINLPKTLEITFVNKENLY